MHAGYFFTPVEDLCIDNYNNSLTLWEVKKNHSNITYKMYIHRLTKLQMKIYVYYDIVILKIVRNGCTNSRQMKRFHTVAFQFEVH